ncbi:MAG: c-type cytochrome [Pseudomonadota bacterium]
MNKWARRTGLALLLLALLAVTVFLVAREVGERKMARSIAVAVPELTIITGAQAMEQGRYLFATRGCADCHGANGAGKEVINSGEMLVVSPNITTGPNSATASYQTRDWVRTLRHGVKPDGTPVMIMPSEDYNRLTDADLAAIITYVRQLPPVRGQTSVVDLPGMVKVLYAFGIVRDAAEIIDHKLPPEKPVKVAVSIEHGHYVAHSCIGCHGAKLSGGKIPGAPPEWPATANLTPGAGSVMPRYPTPEAFAAMLRSGKRPDGSLISTVMPFNSLREMTDTDVHALHAYLQTLPARDAGGR